jgi:hypothetical protein
MVAPFTRRDIKPCAVCGERLMTDNPLGLFWRVTAERMAIDQRAVQREAGLETMMGGNVAIAAALSAESSFARTMIEPRAMLICEPCVLNRCGALVNAFLPEDGE